MVKKHLTLHTKSHKDYVFMGLIQGRGFFVICSIVESNNSFDKILDGMLCKWPVVLTMNGVSYAILTSLKILRLEKTLVSVTWTSISKNIWKRVLDSVNSPVVSHLIKSLKMDVLSLYLVFTSVLKNGSNVEKIVEFVQLVQLLMHLLHHRMNKISLYLDHLSHILVPNMEFA